MAASNNQAPYGDPAEQAAIATFEQGVYVGTSGEMDASIMRPVKFDRLSLGFRVLGSIIEQVELDALGPWNTLPALTYLDMRDPARTNPPSTHGCPDGLAQPWAQVAPAVRDRLNALVAAGLVEESKTTVATR